MSRAISDELAVAASQYTSEEKYWLNQLDGEWVKTIFPYDYKKNVNEHRQEYKTGKEAVRFTMNSRISERLQKLSNGSDLRLHMLLTAAVVALLYKYTDTRDILVGMPIYKQDIQGEFINTVLTIRNTIKEGMTFKELLLQLRETIVEASENQNYPIETLLYHLNLPAAGEDFPLFDVAILLENIHDKKYLQHIRYNMTFAFSRTGEQVKGVIEYDPTVYKKTTIERIINHFFLLLETVLFDMDAAVAGIDILSAQEKKQQLEDFNDTQAEYPAHETLHGLFASQAEKTPAHIGLVYKDRETTYGKLNEQANQLAHLLRSKGVGPDTIVGIMVERSPEMIEGLLAILKAGAAYLPISPGTPKIRLRAMLEACGSTLLVTKQHIPGTSFAGEREIPAADFKGEILKLDRLDLAKEPNINPGNINQPRDLAYVIFTSGSTGKPKGVMIEHRNAVNVVSWFARKYQVQPGTNVLQLSDYTFDASVNQVFGTLLHGAALHLLDEDVLLDTQWMRQYIDKNCIHIVNFVPVMINDWLGNGKKSTSIRAILSGGERLDDSLKDRLLNMGYELFNQYGPTETTIDALVEKCSTHPVTLGKPIANVQCYILGRDNNLLPTGSPGELCIGGHGLARGYLDNPQLTREKFIGNPFVKGDRLYKSGDLVCLTPEGKIQLLGRIDNQVKIRGYRIELGEIESQLLSYQGIKEAWATTWEKAIDTRNENPYGDQYLCAYFAAEVSMTADIPAIREYLSQQLPDYMLPRYLVQVERIPLTPAGKVDRSALPIPHLEEGPAYVPPSNPTEEKLAEMWAETLKVEKETLGIDDNFFELGGHSLKTTILVSKIHRVFKVRIPLVEFFRMPTIKGLSRYITRTAPVKYESIDPAPLKQYYPLSAAQKRLYFLYLMEPGTIAYNIPKVLRIEGKSDREKLETIFKKLIQRHEILRTSFHTAAGQAVQKIHRQVNFEIEYHRQVSEPDTLLIINNFPRPFDLSRAPLMRVGLIDSEANEFILMVDRHHIVSDINSEALLEEEFKVLYAGQEEDLPPLRLQYKDYAEWQNLWAASGEMKKQEEYWRELFAGDLPLLEIPTDSPRPLLYSFEGSAYPFHLEKKETEILKQIALEGKTTLFVVLLTLYYILLWRICGQEDIVVGTPAAGRRHAHLEPIVGIFLNTLVLRAHPRGGKTFVSFLEETRKTVLEAFENQEYPLEELVETVMEHRQMDRNPLFDVMFSYQEMENRPQESLSLLNIKVKVHEIEKTTSKFDMILHAAAAKDTLRFTFEYCTKLFKEKTIRRFANYFTEIVTTVIANKHKRLEEIRVTHRLGDADAAVPAMEFAF